jgi:predicted RNA-binding Zn-ribbon protein involved in translation (DUF1610 family)
MKYKIAAIYDNYITAHLALGNLQNENIDCWLKDENTVTIDPILTNAIGGIKLMVAEPQLEQALYLLQEIKKEYQQQNPCPQCGSTNVEYVSTPRKASNWLSVLAGGLTMSFAPGVEKVYHCFDCGFEFNLEV